MPSSPCSTKSCRCVPCCHLLQFWGAAYVSKTKWDSQLREGPEWRHRGNSPWQRTKVLCHSVPIYVSMSLLVTLVSHCFGIKCVIIFVTVCKVCCYLGENWFIDLFPADPKMCDMVWKTCFCDWTKLLRKWHGNTKFVCSYTAWNILVFLPGLHFEGYFIKYVLSKILACWLSLLILLCNMFFFVPAFGHDHIFISIIDCSCFP